MLSIELAFFFHWLFFGKESKFRFVSEISFVLMRSSVLKASVFDAATHATDTSESSICLVYYNIISGL